MNNRLTELNVPAYVSITWGSRDSKSYNWMSKRLTTSHVSQLY